MNPTLFRWTAFLAGVLPLTAGCLPFTFLPSFDHPGSGRSVGFLLQSIGLIACWGFFPIDRPRIRSALILIVVVSLLPRLLLLPTPPSDDIHRYRWEGKLGLAGENPFARTAADPDLISYRDGDWEKMNHKENGTVYPPLAQGVFAVLATLAPSTSGDLIHKTAFLLADIGTLFPVLYLLRRRRLPLAFALFYSLNPIVLIGIAGEAHYDSILVLALVGSIASLEAGKVRLSWIFLAASLQLKLISLVLLPLWWFQRAWRGWYWAPQGSRKNSPPNRVESYSPSWWAPFSGKGGVPQPSLAGFSVASSSAAPSSISGTSPG